jgi:hypothetical protein
MGKDVRPLQSVYKTGILAMLTVTRGLEDLAFRVMIFVVLICSYLLFDALY